MPAVSDASKLSGFDVVVVGAGITGCEAAWRCARGGLSTLLVTTSLDTSYNLARDAERLLPPPGSLMAELLPALTGPDGTVRNFALHRAVKQALEFEPGLHTLQSTISGLRVDDGQVTGVETWEGVDRVAGLTALCVGSFLRARLSVGTLVEQQGRLSEMAYDELYLDLERRGFEFVIERFSLEAGHGAPAYQVVTPVFEQAEFPGPGLASRRLGALFAAGACVHSPEAGPPGYEDAARQGLALGDALLAAAG